MSVLAPVGHVGHRRVAGAPASTPRRLPCHWSCRRRGTSRRADLRGRRDRRIAEDDEGFVTTSPTLPADRSSGSFAPQHQAVPRPRPACRRAAPATWRVPFSRSIDVRQPVPAVPEREPLDHEDPPPPPPCEAREPRRPPHADRPAQQLRRTARARPPPLPRRAAASALDRVRRACRSRPSRRTNGCPALPAT